MFAAEGNSDSPGLFFVSVLNIPNILNSFTFVSTPFLLGNPFLSLGQTLRFFIKVLRVPVISQTSWDVVVQDLFLVQTVENFPVETVSKILRLFCISCFEFLYKRLSRFLQLFCQTGKLVSPPVIPLCLQV